ncbi:conserved hypothetical protein, variant [Coccidioides immitis H538.4]|uniref:INO80 complex subunit F domain-containing protein n=1 Tax=Coccidioides immitis H538.4 TaxID=396776 RepID=A0A0J8S4B7_COCIT|nr:conserved hypothetical protein, variant [Coccidioides immitis H538.4]
MEANEPNPLSQPPTNASNAPPPPPNPPSIESAYKQKCIDLKKRLQEIESHNEALRARNERGHRYLQKMRLESCILLERLGLLTGMTDENGPGPEIRARALALMNQATSLLDDHEGGLCRPPVRPKARFLMKRITWMMKVLEAQKTGLLPLRNGPFVPRGIARLKTMLRVMERGTTMPTLLALPFPPLCLPLFHTPLRLDITSLDFRLKTPLHLLLPTRLLQRP